MTTTPSNGDELQLYSDVGSMIENPRRGATFGGRAGGADEDGIDLTGAIGWILAAYVNQDDQDDQDARQQAAETAVDWCDAHDLPQRYRLLAARAGFTVDEVRDSTPRPDALLLEGMALIRETPELRARIAAALAGVEEYRTGLQRRS